MAYFSLMYETSQQEQLSAADIMVPNYLKDLRLFCIPMFRQKIDESEFRLFALAADEKTILYRQNIFKDLEKINDCQMLWKFSAKLKVVKRLLDCSHLTNSSLKRGKYLADSFCELHNLLSVLIKMLQTSSTSIGLTNLKNFFIDYYNAIGENTFSEAQKLKSEIEEIRWNIKLTDKFISISDSSISCSDSYLDTLADILHLDRLDPEIFFTFPEENCLFEKQFLTLFTRSYPFTVNNLETFAQTSIIPNLKFLEQSAEELNFYLDGITLMHSLAEKGFHISYATIGTSFSLHDICEIELALSCHSSTEIISNNLVLTSDAKGAWICGDNQGGKTTYLKSVGQTVFLSLLGFPAIGSNIHIPMISGIYTHFPMEENIRTSDGKLVEELKHLYTLKENSRENALFLFNEMFASTTLADAAEMSQDFVLRCIKDKQYVFSVTNIPELADTSVQMKNLHSCSHPAMKFKIEEGTCSKMPWSCINSNQYQLTAENIRSRIYEQEFNNQRFKT